MKEFLEKQENGGYKLVYHKTDIEVPEGADAYTFGQGFYKNNGSEFFIDGKKWIKNDYGYQSIVLWVRPTHPEPLPFIDDNPQSLNDQYAEIEQVRQNQKTTDAMREAEGILSDKQLKGVDATLAQRQSEYGSFEDVAFVTENIMATLAKVRSNGLHDLPHTHRMALYMIASKMARIVNGDFNKLDSWHDIGGYAKLIENLIEGK